MCIDFVLCSIVLNGKENLWFLPFSLLILSYFNIYNERLN